MVVLLYRITFRNHDNGSISYALFLHFLPPEKFFCVYYFKSPSNPSVGSLYPRSILSKFLFYLLIKSSQKYFS